MKKRLLSVVLALAMILSTMSVLAFAADTSLAALIANAADGATVDWTGGDVTIADTITINKSITIDLNGAKIRSAKAPILDDESSDHFGKAIFNITGGDVEIINGYILGEYTKIDVDAVNTETVLNYATVIANLKSADAAIQVNGGNLTLNCTVVVGGMMYAERVYSLVN